MSGGADDQLLAPREAVTALEDPRQPPRGRTHLDASALRLLIPRLIHSTGLVLLFPAKDLALFACEKSITRTYRRGVRTVKALEVRSTGLRFRRYVTF